MNSSGFEGSDGGTLEMDFSTIVLNNTLDEGSGVIAYLHFTTQDEGTVSIDTLEGCGLSFTIYYENDLDIGACYELGQIQIAQFICGNCDGEGEVDIDDIVYLINYVFLSGPPPIPLPSDNVNCAGGIDIDDIVYLVCYVFQNGYLPCDPDGDGIPDC